MFAGIAARTAVNATGRPIAHSWAEDSEGARMEEKSSERRVQLAEEAVDVPDRTRAPCLPTRRNVCELGKLLT